MPRTAKKSSPGRAPGRPVAADDPKERVKRIAAAYLRFEREMTVEAVAARLKVSPRTVYYWTAQALTYPDDPGVAFLRYLTGRS